MKLSDLRRTHTDPSLWRFRADFKICDEQRLLDAAVKSLIGVWLTKNEAGHETPWTEADIRRTLVRSDGSSNSGYWIKVLLNQQLGTVVEKRDYFLACGLETLSWDTEPKEVRRW
jgi:hypothetical protein